MATVAGIEAPEKVHEDATWVARSIERCLKALAVARTPADRLALIRSLIRLKGGRIDMDSLPRDLIQDDNALLGRFGLARTNSDTALRIVDEEDQPGLDGLTAALRFDSIPRHAYEPASPDGVLLRLSQHERYRTIAQKAATRALLTQPPGSGLMVSMPTGSGKSLLFQIAANFERETQPGACAIVITPTVALALDHERTLSGMRGLEASKALTGDTPFAKSEAIINGFRRGEIPLVLLSPEKALNPVLLDHLGSVPPTAVVRHSAGRQVGSVNGAGGRRRSGCPGGRRLRRGRCGLGRGRQTGPAR